MSEQERLETVELGLLDFVALPMKIPRAINGKDVFIVEDGGNPIRGTITMIGRKARIQRGLRQELVKKYPNLFHPQEVVVPQEVPA